MAVSTMTAAAAGTIEDARAPKGVPVPGDPQPVSGLLGDTPQRDYSQKLQWFNSFAEPELRRGIASLDLQPGMRVLDAGCGTGEALAWLAEATQPGGKVVGCDLAAAHAAAALAQVSRRTPDAPRALVLQADLLRPPFPPASFDLIWSVNTLNHLRDRVRGIELLSSLLRPGGRIAVGQSSLVPDMYFAWDARLERLVNEAVRQYYRDRYRIDERGLTSVRSLVGALRQAGLRGVTARTYMIERICPLDAATERYLSEAIFRDTWGERLRPYLPVEEYAQLIRLCDPGHPEYALRRPDFHFLQSFTLVVAQNCS